MHVFFLMISVLYTPPFLFHTITTSLFQFYLVLLAVVTNFFWNLVVLFPPPLLPPTCFSNFLPDQGHSPSLPVEMQEAGLQCPGMDHCCDTAVTDPIVQWQLTQSALRYSCTDYQQHVSVNAACGKHGPATAPLSETSTSGAVTHPGALWKVKIPKMMPASVAIGQASKI